MNHSRTIDVIFIHPKHRSYVIWHDGKFHQLARMEITKSSWDRRKPYDGSLDEIFVSSESCGQPDPRLSALGFVAMGLPQELQGVTASKFLSWWTVNRYGFWQAQRAGVSDDKSAHADKNIMGNKTNDDLSDKDDLSNTKTDLANKTATQTAQEIQPPVNTTVKAQDVPVNHTPPPQSTTPKTANAQAGSHKSNDEKPTMTSTPTPTKPTHKPIEELSGDEIFDALFDDLIGK